MMMTIIRDFGPIVISVFALIVAVLSYLSARRNEQRSIRSKEPLITASISRVKDQPGWFSISFSVESRANHGYRCNYIEIRRPLFARGISTEQASGPVDLYGDRKLINPLPLQRASRKAPMNFEKGKAGSVRSQGGSSPGAKHWDTIFVYVPRWILSKSLSMRVSLSSIEAEERESFFTVNRTLPAAAKTMMD